MGFLQKLFSIFSGGKKESAGPTSTTGSRPQAAPQPQPQTQDFQAPPTPKAPPPQTQDLPRPAAQQPAPAEQPAELSPDLLGGEGGPAGATMAFTLPSVAAASLVVRSGGEPGFIFGLLG